MSSVSSLARSALSLGLPAGILDRGPSLRGTKFLAKAALKARLSGAKRRFQMVNVGACDGVLFDDVTPWLHRIPHARAVLVEPIPHNQKRLRANYTDKGRRRTRGWHAADRVHRLLVGDRHQFDVGQECLGPGRCQLQQIRAAPQGYRSAVGDIADAARPQRHHPYRPFLVDCEGADWIVFEQLDLERYRPGMIKVEVGALPAAEIGQVVVKLKTAGYQVGFQAEDIWAFA
jgi:hypothetical protein